MTTYKSMPLNIKNKNQKTKIFIVGYHEFIIDRLTSILESRDNSYLVSCVQPGSACMAKLIATEPDVLLIESCSLKEPMERIIQGIIEEYPNIRILAFGTNMDDEYLYRLIRAGAHGYIHERMSSTHIQTAMDRVTTGQTWIERHIMERFISTQHDFDEVLESQFALRIEHLCTSLTKRETEILCQVVQGMAIKQIAEQVHLSHQGVKMHLAKLFKKFKVTNRNQLIIAAFDEISPAEDISVLFRSGLERQMGSIPAQETPRT